MKATQLARAIAICAQAGRPSYTESEPGVGKSSVHRWVAKSTGRKFLDRRLAQEDAVDSRGLPSVVKGRTVYALPAWLPTGPGAAIFLDEIVQAPTLVQNAYSELILDRTLGGEDCYKLPADTVIWAAGNRRADRAGANEMPSQLRNRFVQFTQEFDLDDYVAHHMDPDAVTTLNVPKIERSSQMHEYVLAFARFRPTLIQKFDPNAKQSPTARSWSFVSDLLPYLQLNEDLMYVCVEGCVGEGPAVEFTSFVRLIDKMPDPEVVFKNPEHAPIPVNEPGIMYALMTALAARVTPKNADAYFTYIMRKEMPQDMSVMSARDAIKRNATLLACKKGMEWTTKNSKFLI